MQGKQLESRIRQKEGNNDVIVIVRKIRRGSMDIDADVIIPDTADKTTDLINAAIELVEVDEPIIIDNKTGRIQKITIDNSTYDATTIDSEPFKCAVFEALQGPCHTGYICRVSAGVAECTVRPEPDNFTVIIGVGVGVPLFLIALAAFVLVCIYIRRRITGSGKYYDTDSSTNEQVSQFAQQIPMRYHDRFTVQGASYYDPGQIESVSESVAPTYHYNDTQVEEQPTTSNVTWDFVYRHIDPHKMAVFPKIHTAIAVEEK